MDVVRIVPIPSAKPKDILENVYDNYTEIGGQDENSSTPSCHRPGLTSPAAGDKSTTQPVMVIGQERCHGQEGSRNGVSFKPWGKTPRPCSTEGRRDRKNSQPHLRLHPRGLPVEDYPGAAQQNRPQHLRDGRLKVPVVSVISEGGSGGAEAIACRDARLMFSHGYYSVISPEGAAAAIEAAPAGQRVPPSSTRPAPPGSR
jgi:acetyl-CoA carboxylase carboxyl transferase subunit beta